MKRGEKKVEVSHFFKISRNTLDLWPKKERETPDVKASLPVGVGTRPKIQDLKKFEEFVRKNSDKTQKLMAQLWVMRILNRILVRLVNNSELLEKNNLWLSRKRARKKSIISRKARKNCQ